METDMKITVRVNSAKYKAQKAAILASGREVSDVVREALAKAANDASEIGNSHD